MIELTRKQALKIRAIIEQASSSLNDRTASEVPMLFGIMKYDGQLIQLGTRINWHGVLKRASIDIWDLEINNPDNAPTLWEDIPYKNGIRIIPEVIMAGTSFSLGEQGYWKDVLYESMMDNNVWNPEQNPSGWKVAEA